MLGTTRSSTSLNYNCVKLISIWIIMEIETIDTLDQRYFINFILLVCWKISIPTKKNLNTLSIRKLDVAVHLKLDKYVRKFAALTDN